MLTRFVRNQLIIFTVASVIGMAVMVFGYMQLPALFGWGKITVTLELPAGGGLYRFANVTYRGVQVGKVTSVAPTPQGASATLTLNTSPKIPADLHAAVRSISAVGEQYVELLPQSDTRGYLHDGSVISMRNTSIPQQVGPMLDQVSKLVDSIPKGKLGQLLDETYQGFNGAGYDLGSLLDSSAKVTTDINGVADQTRGFIDDAVPLLDSQAQTTDAISTWTHSLAGISDHLVADDPHLRTILATAPGAAEEVSALLNQIKPTLPVLLANLTTVGQILVTYNPGLEQILVLLPAYIANQDSFALPQNNPTGWPLADFTATANDPPPCTVGFLPPSQWRSPADTTTIDTPDGLYCKLPQDSPISVRGARNYPCMGKPGKRAPTVEICNSDQPFIPDAMRQHALGAAPIDPNLVSQGIPPDTRVDPNANIYGPLGGTPLPPPATPPAPAVDGGGTLVAPSAFDNASGSHPSVAMARYDPATGRYLSPDGHLVQQSNLISGSTAKSWKDLLPS
ncbi:virulence factor Mce-like protein [Mycolicibacterium sp. BK634]|uniref:MCE family protein n=1 Tax=Mycolicibacterium sp. BK634 TaxID=2587099 RepID=UPI00161E20FF|nr:MlaD family protein [Mycolicibacterium sp. BK634]MBB3748164.1 virulence factor Mce-like protein [Mycolicibacterium sp. BK634]